MNTLHFRRKKKTRQLRKKEKNANLFEGFSRVNSSPLRRFRKSLGLEER